MSRLIDAGLLLDNLSSRLESMKDYDAIKDVVKNMPTAYDLCKVVEQLEKESYQEWCDSSKIVELKDAIEIVKGGGVNE